MTAQEHVDAWWEANEIVTPDALLKLAEVIAATERARCYKIAFEAVATTKDGLHVKASIADAIACGEFEAALR